MPHLGLQHVVGIVSLFPSLLPVLVNVQSSPGSSPQGVTAVDPAAQAHILPA